MTTAQITAMLAATAFLAGCDTPHDWDNLPVHVTGDVAQDPDIATTSGRVITAQAERLPRLSLVDCGPFRVDIRSHRIAPGLDDRQADSDSTSTPDLALIVQTPEGFNGRFRFNRATMPFSDARILYQTGAGWQDVTSFGTAVALGASVPVLIEPEPGATVTTLPPRVDLYPGFDPARNPLLVVDRKFSVTDVWTAFADPDEAASPNTRLRPGNYRITTNARYELDSAIGGCAFTLPDLLWRVPA